MKNAVSLSDEAMLSRNGQARRRSAAPSIHALLTSQAMARPEAIAIMAPGRRPLTYRRLLGRVEATVAALRGCGLGRDDRVAVVLPNGPDMAVAFAGVAAGATCAPLNPAYRASEFEFYLTDLGAKALLVGSELDSPAREVALGRLADDVARTAAPMAAVANDRSHDFFSARIGCQRWNALSGLDLGSLCIRSGS